MKRIFISVFFIGVLQSCVFIRMDDSIDLGDQYRYVQDYPQAIIFHKTPKYKGAGINIVPPVVLSYSFNERYIVAKSQEIDEMTGNKEGKPIHYWLVDKNDNGTMISPMDSVTFYKRLQELEINLAISNSP